MIDRFSIRRARCCAGAAGAAAFGLTGAANAQKPLVVGFIYVGPRDDYGYNQAHAEGRRRAEEDGRPQGGRGREGA
jgi:simple sugar transport system substrate-binding protein